MDSTASESSPVTSSGAGQYVMMTSSGPPGAFVGSSSVTSSTSSSTSSAALMQYLNPDYVQPLSTSLDVKNSPLALLAQTCSSIGRDNGTSASSVVKNNAASSSLTVSGSGGGGGHHGREGSSLSSSAGSLRSKCSSSPVASGKTASTTATQQLHKSTSNSSDRKMTNGFLSRHTGNANSTESTSPSSVSKSKVGNINNNNSARTRNTSEHRTGSSSSISSGGGGGGKSDGGGSPSPTINSTVSGFAAKSSSGLSSGQFSSSVKQETAVSGQLRYSLNDDYQYHNNNNTHSSLFSVGSEMGSSVPTSFDKFLLSGLDGQSGTSLQQLHMQQQAARYQNEALALQAAIQAAIYSSSPLAALYGGASATPGGPPGAGCASNPGLAIPPGADQASLQAAAVYSAGLQAAAAAAAAASGLYPPVPRSDLFCSSGSSASNGSPCTVPGCGCANAPGGADALSSLRYPSSATSLFPPPSSLGGLFGGSSSTTVGLMPSSGGIGGPYACSWLQQPSGEFCGRHFATSVELLDHLRTHAAPAPSSSQTSPVDAHRGLSGRRSPQPTSPPTSSASSSLHGHRPLVVPPLLPPLPPHSLGFPSAASYTSSAASIFDRLSAGSGRAPSPQPSSLFLASRHQTGPGGSSRHDAVSPSSLLFQAAAAAASSTSSSSSSRYHPYRLNQPSTSSSLASPAIAGGIGSSLHPVDAVSPASFLPGGVVPPPPIPSSLMAAYLSSPYAATLYSSQRLGPAVGP